MKSGLTLVAPSALSAAILFTDYLVKGVQLLPNGSITRIAGDYYFIFQIYALAAVTLAVSLLIVNLFLKNDYHLKAKSITALIGFSPFIAFILILIPLMQAGYEVNMAGFSSLSISFMLIFFISATDKYKLFTIMQFVPFSHSRAQYLEVRSLLRRRLKLTAGDVVDMKAFLRDFETLIIKHTYHHAETQKEAARRLNISESNLSRKVAPR
ncbi:hypothetical protein [Marinomonas transparens]|nr:hypothetical protein [Marinomonas transparens]